ncbi:MAG: hypothetical protein H6575_19525 [Lewinellaceae bacterium]|nr:hypothetical protein [Saprospiraceae bacterium]MCB9356761.1 hypothetical protein [Lewinellaceae bacterium]
MKSFLLPASLLIPLCLSGQLEQILQDPEVNWAAEIEITLPADPLANSNDEDRSAAMAVLKLNESDQSLDRYISHSLNAKLWDIAENGDWEAYSNADLTRPLDIDELMNIVSGPDSIVTVDPDTYEEKVQLSWNTHPGPHDARYVKVRQLLTYNDEEALFSIRTLAIAPFTGNEEPRFWLKVPEESPVDPDSMFMRPDFTWAVRYITNVSSPQVSDFQVLKDETGPIMDRFFDRIMGDTLVDIYETATDDEPLAGIRRQCVFSCTDSVSTFDPETYLEHVEIFYTELLPDQIVDLQLIEEIYWQDEDGLLYTRLVAVAPRYKSYYQEGQWFPRVGFYRRCDE